MRTGDFESIGLFRENESLSARKMSRLVKSATPHLTAGHVFIDSNGAYHRPVASPTEGTSLLLYEIVSIPTYDTSYYEYKATVKPVNEVSGIYTLDGSASAETVWFPLVPRRDLLSGVTSDQAAKTRLVAYIGQRLYVKTRDDGDLEAVTPPLIRWRGELKDDHAPGNTSTCYLYYHTGSAYATDTAIEFEAVDVFSEFRGRRRGKYNSPHDSGSFVIAQYMPDSNVFEMGWMTPHALKIEGLTTAAVGGSDYYISSSSIKIMNPIGSIITNADPAQNIPINNKYSHNGDSGAETEATWHENHASGARYVGTQMECPA